MTLPQNGKKLTKNEEKSMEIALKESGIKAIHPERMEEFAEYLVQKLKEQNTKVESKPWRNGSPLSE